MPKETPLNILIVDDDEFVAEILSAGFETETEIRIHNSQSADAFWNAVVLVRPQCIILDLFLPDINGLDLLKQIKANLELKSIPIIVMSGTDDLRIRRAVLDAGAAQFVTKPFGIADLKHLIGVVTRD